MEKWEEAQRWKGKGACRYKRITGGVRKAQKDYWGCKEGTRGLLGVQEKAQRCLYNNLPIVHLEDKTGEESFTLFPVDMTCRRPLFSVELYFCTASEHDGLGNI